MTTCVVLAEAAKYLPEALSRVTLLTDSRVENVNCTVDEFLANGTLKRVLAQVEIVESNSLVESFWRGLKHSVMPHSALDYRTPDEVYFGRAEDLPSNLEVARRTAREA